MRARRLPTAALGVTIAIIAIVTPAARVGAATAACTKTSGVTVVVDFTYFHRSIERGCAPGSSATALDAVRGAGFGTSGTTRYGEAFLCRIDDLPSPKVEACVDTPPARASWSFYFARPDASAWTFSAAGVLGYRPRAGTIIAFAFGNNAKPSVAPAAVRPKAAPTTTRTTTVTPSTAPPATPPVAAAVATTLPGAPPTPTSTRAPSTTIPRAVPLHRTTPLHTTTSTTAAATRVVDRPPATHVTLGGSSSSPIGVMLGAALVLGLGVAAALTIRARRHRAT